MQARDFIHSELTVFIKCFPMTRVRYEYDKLSQVHFIEVSPLETYKSDRDYIQWEEEFYKRFVEAFPAECICFVSDDKLVGIENPELVLTGSEYLLTTFFTKEVKYDFATVVIHSNNFEDATFTECTIERNTASFDLPKSYTGSNIPKAA